MEGLHADRLIFKDVNRVSLQRTQPPRNNENVNENVTVAVTVKPFGSHNTPLSARKKVLQVSSLKQTNEKYDFLNT